jgi:predicted peptidase
MPPTSSILPALAAALAGAVLFACAAPRSAHRPPPAPSPGSFVSRAVTVGGVEHRYQVYVPAGHDAGREWPVVLFLHGAGERGDDGERPVQVGLAPAIRRDPAFPAIVVFPQAAPDSAWYGVEAEMALAALEASVQEWNGDRDRIYLTGLSMGGYGALRMAVDHPGRFAAVAVVCGGAVAPASRPYLRWRDVPADADLHEWAAERLRDTPVWLFHGALDDVIPVEESRRVAAALEATGAPVRYTEYPDANHNAWDRAYAERGLWEWMFGKAVRR